MSAHNGDKSRYQVNRKRAVLRRSKIRELVKAAKAGTATKPAAKGRQSRPPRSRSRTPPRASSSRRQACTPGASCPVRSTYSTYEPR
jgi:hypothetical protein